MPLLAIPQPYDFEVSTERFRAFGPDVANLWHEGGLHRVVGGREVRIEAAPGGVLVEPLDAAIEAEVSTLLGLPFDLDAFYRGAIDPTVVDLVSKLEGFRPPLAPDPFESLVTSITAQQVSLFAAFAIRNRMIERYGTRGDHAYAFPTSERIARGRRGRALSLGFSRRKAEYVVGLAPRRPRPRRARASCPTRRSRRVSRRARPRRVDGRLVPRAPPRAAARLGAPATSACARRCRCSMVTCDVHARRASASTPSRT